MFRSTQPNTAEITEPQRTPSFASLRNAMPAFPKPAYDRSAMNIETVKPIPQTTQTLANDFQSAPAGRLTNLSRTASHEKLNTPRNFHITRPNITANPTPENRLPTLI